MAWGWIPSRASTDKPDKPVEIKDTDKSKSVTWGINREGVMAVVNGVEMTLDEYAQKYADKAPEKQDDK